MTSIGGTTPSTTSLLRHVDARYGGWGYACNNAMVQVNNGRRVSIDSSSLVSAQQSGIYLYANNTAPPTDASRVQVTNSTFASSACGIMAASRNLTVRYNVFASTLTSRGLFLASTAASVVEWNSFASTVRIYEPASGLNRFRYNDFANVDWLPYDKPKDLRHNWWGHVVQEPGFCRSATTPANPKYNLGSTGCGTQLKVVSYQTLVLPALTASAISSAAPVGGPSTPQNNRGGRNESGATRPCGTSVADPIDCSSGNFWHRFAGLAVAGRGMALDFDFTYNSDASAEDGSLGFGFTHSYAMRVTTSGTTATVHQENGAQVPFTQAGSGWVAPGRFEATLTSDVTGWTFTRRGRERFTFDAAGRLTSQRDLTDPATYVTTVAYPSASAMVVTDVAGRTLSFALSAGRISTVTDTASPPRQVAFTYNLVGELTGFTDARGGSWAFGYEATGSHRMTTLRKPNQAGQSPPPVVTNVYDPQGRTVAQTDQLGRTTSLDYGAVTGSPLTTTLVTDPRGNRP